MQESASTVVLKAGLDNHGEEAVTKALQLALQNTQNLESPVDPILTLPPAALLLLSTELNNYPNFLQDALISALINHENLLEQIITSAVKAGNLELVSHLTALETKSGACLFHSLKPVAHRAVLHTATATGHLNIIKFLTELKSHKGEWVIKVGALHADEASYRSTVYQKAAAVGRLDILQYFQSLQHDGAPRFPQLDNCKEIKEVVEICIEAAENHHLNVVRYLTTLRDQNGKTLVDLFQSDYTILAPCLSTFKLFPHKLSALSMFNLLFKSHMPNLSQLKQRSNSQYKKPILELELYLNKEAELTKAASLDSPYQLYEMKDKADSETLELRCCLYYKTPLLSAELTLFMTTIFLSATSKPLYTALVCHTLADQEIQTIKVEGIETLSDNSKAHLALLEKAVAATAHSPELFKL